MVYPNQASANRPCTLEHLDKLCDSNMTACDFQQQESCEQLVPCSLMNRNMGYTAFVRGVDHSCKTISINNSTLPSICYTVIYMMVRVGVRVGLGLV